MKETKKQNLICASREKLAEEHRKNTKISSTNVNLERRKITKNSFFNRCMKRERCLSQIDVDVR